MHCPLYKKTCCLRTEQSGNMSSYTEDSAWNPHDFFISYGIYFTDEGLTGPKRLDGFEK